MERPDLSNEFPPCACDKCRALCQRPCWPTPSDVQRLVAAGYGPKLMLAWWEQAGTEERIVWVPCPAVSGHEGFYAPAPEDWDHYDTTRRCVMQTPDGLCQLHAVGLKPLEGRLATGCAPYPGGAIRRAIAGLWATPEGQQVASDWRRHYAKG